MRFEYQINNQNEIRVWDLENPNEKNAPFLLQPTWPNNTAWKDRAEAESWVKVFIESLENDESEFIAGNSPETHPRPRPEPIKYDPNTGEPITGA